MIWIFDESFKDRENLQVVFNDGIAKFDPVSGDLRPSSQTSAANGPFTHLRRAIIGTIDVNAPGDSQEIARFDYKIHDANGTVPWAGTEESGPFDKPRSPP